VIVEPIGSKEVAAGGRMHLREGGAWGYPPEGLAHSGRRVEAAHYVTRLICDEVATGFGRTGTL